MEVAAAISATDPFDPGYRLLRRVFDRAEITALAPVLARIPSSAAGRRWAGHELVALLQSPPMQPILRKLAELLPDMAILRAVAFRKDADANWFVPAHQDRSIPVPSVALPPGFDHVTRKPDGWQAEAPVALLAKMRNCRIFVDRATIEDGPLEVLPGSHRRGRIEQAEIPTIAGHWVPLIGEVGDAVILSPLLLHRSRRATDPSGRRVLQLELIPSEMAEALGLSAC
ncbi:phytanoyl-CoA dioxygenase family protein [Dongia sedimenti]|uniref:Phytanoyl-CoA dioxygenase family protein n=1 Tax=Dongia sedimenti TaxID=3064282 RepID=A0ABU0YMX9_9PROT|nr:phytanoyl-CoA dioxygenase family protein [Rhodospirillaceae bacterium R-7]